MTSFVFICEKNTNALGITNICTNPIIEQLECVRDVTSDRQQRAGGVRGMVDEWKSCLH